MTLRMDVEALEAEAKATAAKHVANMLQRPGQLEKVEQYMRRVSRKKASVEAMLKTAMQTQLDGVKTGLTQLNAALQDIRELKQSIRETEETFKEIPSLVENLQEVKNESIKHCQYAATVENLKHIFNVPESVQKTQDQINDGKLLLAHQSLADLENSRDELLFEMHKLPKQSPTDRNMLKHYFSYVEKLSEQLSKQLWLILRRTLNSVRKEPQVIVTAVRIIEREEYADGAALKRQADAGFLAPGRPKQWRKKAFEVLKQAVSERIEGSQCDERRDTKMWLVRHLEIIRQLVMEDLKVVKTACVPCFPRKYNIVDEFVKMYHDGISKHLLDIISNGLESNEYITLLNWLNIYEGPELLGHPDLWIDAKKLGPLLENDVVEKLMEQYLMTLKTNYQDWMKNSIQRDITDWYKDNEPEKDGDGIFHTSLPLIVFQMVDQNLQVAKTVNQELVNRVMIVSLEHLATLSNQYGGAVFEYKNRYFSDRRQVRGFTYIMIAIANNCVQMSGNVQRICQKYWKNSDKESCNTEFEKFCRNVLMSFDRFGKEALEYLLQELILDTEKELNDLATRKWLLSGSNIVETIYFTIEDFFRDYAHLHPQNFHQIFMRSQTHVAKSYISAVFQRRMTCKSYDERKQFAEKMKDEAGSLQSFFDRLAPLHVKKASPFEALAALSEVIKLKDISMLSLELSGLLRQYPDLIIEQLMALILVRGDVGRNDSKQLVLDIMREEGNRGNHEGVERTIFSNIIVNL